MKRFFYILFLGAVCHINGQQNYEIGKLIDSIPVSNTASETFALYLPKSFDPSQTSPILFIFDPVGRGRIGVETFMEVAENYGFILVCSNNSRNAPYERNFNIAANLFDHIFSRFTIDDKQMYLAGFSGGSRLAWAIAVAAGNIRGVIACGAGFSEAPSPLLKKQELSYAGIIGNRDMNYGEMLEVKAYLTKANYDNTLFIYEGDHNWPPPRVIARAFNWLDVAAHKKGVKVKAEVELYKSYSDDYNIAVKSESSGNTLQAAAEYERILSTYSSLYTLDTVAARLSRLTKDSAYKRALKARSKALAEEKEWTAILYRQFIKDYEQPEKLDMAWWEKILSQLNTKYATAAVEFQNMLERVKFNLLAQAFSRKNPLLFNPTEAQKRFCNELGQVIYSD